jgi:hypothetical protein
VFSTIILVLFLAWCSLGIIIVYQRRDELRELARVFERNGCSIVEHLFGLLFLVVIAPVSRFRPS